MVSTLKKSVIGVLVSCFLLFLSFASAYCAGSEVLRKYSIRKGHPRLFITRERLDGIRRRCADKRGAQARYYKILKDFADKFDPAQRKPSAYYCLTLAFLYVVGEIPGYDYSRRSVQDYGRLGAEMLMKIVPPKDLSYFARYAPRLIACYDWLYSAMAPEERAKIFRNFVQVCDMMKDLLKRSMGNRWRGTREMFSYYGLAFYGDGKAMYPNDPSKADFVDEKAKEYVDFFVAWHSQQDLGIFETACKGGANPDGTMYGEAPYPGRLWRLDAWNTASDDQLYSKTTFIAGYPLFWLYQMLPYRTGVRYDNANGRIDQPGGIVRYGDYRYIGYTPVSGRFNNTNIAQAQGVAARQGRLDLAALFNWLIQYQGDFQIEPFGGPFPTKRWVGAGPALVWDLIFRDGLIKARSPAELELPLAHHFGSTRSGPAMEPDFPRGRPEGAGVVVMRSSWDDPDGTLLWFKASSHLLSHSHRDQGSFQIYKRGWLAIDSGQYEETSHHGNYSVRTVAHNGILVYDPTERLDKDKVDPVWWGYGNDGGQRWVKFLKTADDAKDTRHYLGGIRRFESVQGVYDYAQADITRSYNCKYVTTEGHEPKVSLVTRSIFFLRPDEYIVIFDRVTSTKAEYPKRWLLHSIYRPKLNGKETFSGTIPYSDRIPGKRGGVKLQGNKHGGISESTDTDMVTIRGWNFGPSDGRLVCRTLLPAKHITRVVGGGDPYGVRRTRLAKPHTKGRTIFVENTEGFRFGDFVYLGDTENPYSKGKRGRPNWPVDKVFYKGWGKIKKIDRETGSLEMVPYHSGIPKLPKGTLVMRSDHANADAFEFMDAEYKQWPMHGEAVANAGPFNMQHGAWRIEIEPVDKNKNDVFLHVMLACDKDSLPRSEAALKEHVKVSGDQDMVEVQVEGKARKFVLQFKRKSLDAYVTVAESGRTLLDHRLVGGASKLTAKAH